MLRPRRRGARRRADGEPRRARQGGGRRGARWREGVVGGSGARTSSEHARRGPRSARWCLPSRVPSRRRRAAVSLTPSTTSSSTRSKRVPVVAPSSRWATTAARTAAPLGTSCTAYCSGVPALAYCSLVRPSSSASAARSNSSSSATSTWITREPALLPWRAGATTLFLAAHTPKATPRATPPPKPRPKRWTGRPKGGPGPSEGSSSPSIAAAQ